MAETPVSYCPDVPVAYDIAPTESHASEIQTARGGREQRRGLFPATGYRRFAASSMSLEQPARRAIKKFLHDARGRLTAFYFWNPAPEVFEDVAAGSVAAVDRIIVPFRLTNPMGMLTGGTVLTDVRVAGVSKAFTTQSLFPRLGTYATLLLFSSVSQYIDCGSSASLRATGDQTLAAWINPFSALATRSIMGNQSSSASGVAFFLLTSRLLQITTNQAGAQTSAQSTGTVPLLTWTHVAVVRSGTGVTFYINGVAAGTGSGITNPVAATASFRVGDAAVALPFDGLISDARYYDSALNAGAIAALYAGSPAATANLRGWWKITEGTGTTATDSSGNANTGTLVNVPVWASGEEEIFFSGNQTGAVTLWGTMRDRLIARSDTDVISNRFMQVADVRAIHDIRIKEVY